MFENSREALILNFKLSEIMLGDLVFPDLEITLQPGVNILTGPSGRGKTTLISRLLGLRGETEIWSPDETTSRPFSFLEAKGSVAYLSQENVILGDSFEDALDNFGRPFFDEVYFKYLIENLHIDFLPESYKSIIYKDNRLSLSGGQVRKTLIVQTLMLDRLIYIFDEPTSSFDHLSSKVFFDFIQSQNIERYFLIITHDKIVFDYKTFNFIEF